MELTGLQNRCYQMESRFIQSFIIILMQKGWNFEDRSIKAYIIGVANLAVATDFDVELLDHFLSYFFANLSRQPVAYDFNYFL